MTLRYADLDFETASGEDLKVVGAWAYAESALTEVLVLVFHVDDEHGDRKWRPGSPSNDVKLRELAADPEVIFVAHNAGFEQAIWAEIMVKEFGLPPIPVERWEDTMATCAWKAYPLKLEKAGQAARLPIDKDMEGNRLTLSMSRPNKKTGMLPARTPETTERIGAYCARDVKVETQLRHKIGLLSNQSSHERGVWLLDQKINQRGVRIDLDFVRQAQRVVDRATVPLLAEFRELTGGLNPGQRDKVISWAGHNGVELENLRKDYLETLLGEDDEADDAGYVSNAAEDDSEADRGLLVALSGHVRRVLEIRQMLGSASIKKLARMRACASADGRARGLLQYHAAGPGRWGGRLLQPQNFPRGSLKCSPDEAVAAIMSGDPAHVETALGLPAIEAVASSLRHALVAAPGKVYCVGDFAGIEARVVLALAGQHDMLREMVEKGSGVYLTMAEAIYGRTPEEWTKDKETIDYAKKAFLAEYTIGKNTVLGCGFQMGARRFHERYCADQPFEFAERVIHTYRKVKAPEVPKLWYGLERAALDGVKRGKGEAYGVTYRIVDDWLVAELPSGWQRIWYPSPRLFHDDKFGKDAWRYSAYKGGRLSQVKAYGGLLTENTVQGLARGLLCASMMRLERAGYPIVLTVHDEVVCEVDEAKADQHEFEQIMAEPTSWARAIGIPIAVEGWIGTRYKK